jgi:hypothetical protein
LPSLLWSSPIFIPSIFTGVNVLHYEPIVQIFTSHKCDLKIMSNVFYGWKQKTLIQLCGWATRSVEFQGCQRIYFLVFSIFGLFCCFAGYCGVILESWFQWWSAILIAQWILFMSCVNHGSTRGLVQNF